MSTWYRLIVAAVLLVSTTTMTTVRAQQAPEYPTQPIRLIVPFPPGGGTDTVGRILGIALNDKFGWNVVVENRPGAGGVVGLGEAARARPNGYTIVLGQTSNLSISPYLYKNISYDVAKDFTPIIAISSQPTVLLVRADRPYKTMAELVDFARANPGKLSIGNSGTGSVGDITTRFFAKEAGIDYLNVPYKGGGPAMNDLLAGQIDAFFASALAALPQLENPAVRVLAITSLNPISQFPDVPVLADTLPGFEAVSRTGILAPAGVPANVVEHLNHQLNVVLADDALRAKVMQEGSIVEGGTVKEFVDTISLDSAKWSEIITKNNLQIN